MEYAIYEGNYERLIKKLAFISKKANKYGLNINFKEVGEEFREVKNEFGTVYTARFIIVDVEGDVVKQNDWVCVATVEHPSNMSDNVIRQIDLTVEIPRKYYDAPMHCDHCHTTRNRSVMFIVHNVVTDEWKMVGKSCLKEFTNGLDPQAVAAHISYYEELIEGESIDPNGHMPDYYSVYKNLLYASEAVRMYGYRSSQGTNRNTKEMTVEHYAYSEGGWGGRNALGDSVQKQVILEIADGFNAHRPENEEFVKNAIEWISNLDTSDESLYMHNLKTIVIKQYIKRSELGILVSLIPTYKKAMERKASDEIRKAENARKAQQSDYVGTVGEKIDFEVKAIALVTSFDTQFGTTYLYEMEDVAGNIYKWFASNSYSVEGVKSVRGTVKKHEEYRGVKGTVLTRCKLA